MTRSRVERGASVDVDTSLRGESMESGLSVYDEVQMMRRQIAKLNHRLMSVELENQQQQQREMVSWNIQGVLKTLLTIQVVQCPRCQTCPKLKLVVVSLNMKMFLDIVQCSIGKTNFVDNLLLILLLSYFDWLCFRCWQLWSLLTLLLKHFCGLTNQCDYHKEILNQ